MYHKNWLGILAAVAVAVSPAAVFAGQSASKTLSWKEVLQYENTRVNNEGSSSVLGVSVGAQVRRINAQAQAYKKVENSFASLTKRGKMSANAINQCKSNYSTLKQAAVANKLFEHYALTAVVPNDFCKLSAQEVAFLQRFFSGKEIPVEARQYKQAVLLLLNYDNAMFWLVINPQNKVITLNYNDPADIENLEELQSHWKQLSVK